VKRIAITGGLACGKSSVCHFLEELGAFVISADDIVHELLSHDVQTQQAIVALLGPQVVNGGQLDRSAIAARVFADPYLLSELERILHPQVEHELQKREKAVSREGKHPLFVAEVPLLWEAEMAGFFDVTVAVMCDEAVCASRYPGTDYAERARRQLSPAEKAARSDYVIYNGAGLPELREETVKLFHELVR
jgi:dephospho-CoA kinase